MCFSLEFGVASCVVLLLFLQSLFLFCFYCNQVQLIVGGCFSWFTWWNWSFQHLGLLDQIGVCLKLQEENKPHQKEEPMLSLQRGLPCFFHFFLSPFLLLDVVLPMPNNSNTNGNYSIKPRPPLSWPRAWVWTDPSSTTTPRGEPNPHHYCIFFVEQCNNYYIYKCNMETRR